MATDADVEDYLTLGLRNRWHPILPSELVKDRPLGLRRLGEPLVVWRDFAGRVHVQADRCPHRGVPLSRGVNCGDRLRCSYHGVEVGPDGTVLKVPGQPGCRLEGTRAVRTYPSFELKGAVFAWFGDALNAEPAEFVVPAELRDDTGYDSFLCYAEWETFWRYLYDNNMDPMHGTFLHAKSHSMYQGDTEASFRVRDTATGFVFEKAGQRDVNFDWSELVDAGSLYVRLEIPYPPSGGPGGNFGIVSYGTPIDGTTTACFFWRCRRAGGWQRDVWRFLYRNRLEARHWAVLEQDRGILQGCGPGLEKHENLYQHDLGLVRLRRLLAQQARTQLEALEGAGRR
ncbi:aromatic ring-hydroxylating dioxygenase subunit alpha [Arenibaculum sp.]|jgi:phenylpropionate dioxygenase-like ring-hydroxylating dioxygenase large terminal subunit|uniref:aromatic ring-hydroxylating dioxygenase subunit alpha n=1 Tax=Arenibaculum sp. TaxID=2865862 RepID=UPI002E153F0E|nr:aromatic ring-hydroxylating dioxygenase subunit alpha [Arenibaculum sp.]